MCDQQPQWSADGKRIAYRRATNQDGCGPNGPPSQIFTMNQDGSAQANISGSMTDNFAPAWSPDDAFVAFTRGSDVTQGCCPGTPPSIWVMGSDGSGPRQLFSPGARPRYSPDGSKILFVRGVPDPNDPLSRNAQIFVINADGSGTATNLSNDPTFYDVHPDWSPDGTKIVFNRFQVDHPDSTRGVYVMNADGSGKTQLISPAPSYTESPVFSPDGAQIAYSRYGQGFATDQIFLMNADASNDHQVTHRASSEGSATNTDWQPLANVTSAAQVPSCVQNGTVTVTVGDASGFHSPPKAVHYQVDGGPEQVAATNGNAAAIALPDGRHSLNFWGENQAGDQETALHTVDVLVDRTGPRVRIVSDQHRTRYGRGQRATFTITASDPISGLTRNPSRRHLRGSTARLGTHTVRALAINRCGARTTRLLRYRVVKAAVRHRRVARPRFTG